MPLYGNAEKLIRDNLTAIAAGNRPLVCAIGYLTDQQFTEINNARAKRKLHTLDSNEILFLGRHVYTSRFADGLLSMT